jgi:hypothetical protein
VGLKPCSLVTRYYSFGGASYVRLTGKLEIQTTRRRIPEERDLYPCEKLKSLSLLWRAAIRAAFVEGLHIYTSQTPLKYLERLKKKHRFNSVIIERWFPSALITELI